ncbi:MAG: phage protein GemA/Gp16 family protein [Candidatus Accumulibacter phosphatis]|uniref:DUF1018 domain-containing protein n=1 Tax=Candidatus Accumulibacter contiguus TaxID=2954381 RepID=A0ABX1T8I4_9PROT|nr:phage protein GemA/Gp16 family protein [Candidatus Accumulibacter contiguus]NMQ05266.1 DUF1018 domain-containing protein [Candidatus Accumulibacter contiguus]
MSTKTLPAAAKPDGTQDRAALIRLIHVGRREIQMSDDAWRAYLQQAFLVQSSTQLSLPRLRAALAHLRRIGFVPKGADGQPLQPMPARPEHEWAFVDCAAVSRQPLLRKILMLMRSLPVTRGRQVAYVEGIARQMAGLGATAVDKPLPMCDEFELRRIVVALVTHIRRVKNRVELVAADA